MSRLFWEGGCNPINPVPDSTPCPYVVKVRKMGSSHYVCSNFSQHERLRPLDSSPHRHDLPSLPSFSEFISLTFPQSDLHYRKVAQRGTNVLSKLHSKLQERVPGQEDPTKNPGYAIGGDSNRTMMRNMKQTAGMESENRKRLPGVPGESNYISGANLSNARNVPFPNPRQFDNDNGSSLTSKSSSRHEVISVSDIGGKDSEQRKRSHMTTTRLYGCPFCPLVLMYQKHLIAHVKEKHERKKPFGCPRDGCWQRFGGLGDMNRHIKTVHDGEKRFSCDICARCFSRRSGLKRHADHVHGGDD